MIIFTLEVKTGIIEKKYMDILDEELTLHAQYVMLRRTLGLYV